MKTKTFVQSYIETALWSSTDSNGVSLDDAKYAETELAPETAERFTKDCAAFIEKGSAVYPEYFVGLAAQTTAHDFWLTRNRHGAGFWDGDYPEVIGEVFTDLAHSFKECDLCVGDDGKIYCA